MASSTDDDQSLAPNRKSSNGLLDALALDLPDDHVSSPISSSSSPIRVSSFQRSNGHLGLMSGHNSPRRKTRKKGARVSHWKRFRGLVLIAGLVSLFFLVNWWMFHLINNAGLRPKASPSSINKPISSVIIKEDLKKKVKVKKPQKTMFGRLLALAAHALAEGQNKPEPKGLWEERFALASNWKPCADQRNWVPSEGNNGYVMITANGGLNQQRVAVCNAVAVARLLNATLVIPKFMYSSVWKDVRRSILSIT